MGGGRDIQDSLFGKQTDPFMNNSLDTQVTVKSHLSKIAYVDVVVYQKLKFVQLIKEVCSDEYKKALTIKTL